MFKGTFVIDKNDIQIYATIILAIIVVLGGGLVLVFKPDLSDKLLPIMMIVIGYFFGNVSSNQGYKLGVSSQAQASKIP